MPLIQRSKRRLEPEEVGSPEEAESPEASPGPPTQRRRTDDASDEENYAGDNGETIQSDDGVERMARKLVRLALSCEFQRKPIRRQEINEKALGTNTRQFKAVFASAQIHLRATFGMEMTELPAKEKVTLQQRRAAQKAASQSKSKTADSFILTSVLPSQLRNPAIIQPLPAPTAAEESKYVAIYTILVSLITLSGGTLPDAKMERYLKKLGLDNYTPVSDFDRTEKLLKRLDKDGYVARIKESSGTGEDDIYWIVGPRGKIEVGHDSIRGLAQAVYGSMDDEETQDFDRKLERSLGMAEKPQRENRDDGEPAERSTQRRKKKRRDEEDEDEDDEDDNDDDE